MNKRVKKLTLNRETIKNLQDELLHPVEGGGISGLPCPSEAGSCPRASCGKCPDLT
jgi:hypothetical protein